MKSKTAGRLKSMLKAGVLVALTAMSSSVLAGTMYLGNPVRPDTVWQPAHCKGGCVVEGHYLKVIYPPVSCREVVWVDGHYDRCGNWIGGHYRFVRAVIVNPEAIRMRCC
jgi:hypothetical protein